MVDVDFVGIGRAAGLSGYFGPKIGTAPEARASGAVVSLVAGARNHRKIEICVPLIVLNLGQKPNSRKT
jgi:hypothetical protein